MFLCCKFFFYYTYHHNLNFLSYYVIFMSPFCIQNNLGLHEINFIFSFWLHWPNYLSEFLIQYIYDVKNKIRYRRHKARSYKRVGPMLCPLWTISCNDQSERHEFWPRLWLFFSPFLFTPKKEGRRKGEWISKNRDPKKILTLRPVNCNHRFGSVKLQKIFPYCTVLTKMFILISELCTFIILYVIGEFFTLTFH